MREYINDGCEIIVGTSFDYVDYMLSLAEEYPDVTFINGSGYETAKNMSVYIAKLRAGPLYDRPPRRQDDEGQ